MRTALGDLDGTALTSVQAFSADMPFNLVLRDGRVGARVTDVEKQP